MAKATNDSDHTQGKTPYLGHMKRQPQLQLNAPYTPNKTSKSCLLSITMHTFNETKANPHSPFEDTQPISFSNQRILTSRKP